MMKTVIRCFSAALALCLCGCASLHSLTVPSNAPPHCHMAMDRETCYPREPYGGTKLDLDQCRRWNEIDFFFGPAVYVMDIPYLIDLPLSAVLDTLALPYTIPHSRAHRKATEDGSNQAAQATAPRVADPGR